MLDIDEPDRIDAYVAAAEHYFRALERPEALFGKPYVPPAEAPHSVARLAAFLTLLRVGPGHVVLDFGAGMCWLSGVLTTMGARTIALDVSPTALRLGRRALRHVPVPPHKPAPRFVVSDGFSFPLPDRSVDRVACFDAFHHVPNKRAMLTEMHRVLREGGLACLAEPGPGHAESPLARQEAERYGVLEDEVDPLELSALARRVGFHSCAIAEHPIATCSTVSPDEFASRPRGGAADPPQIAWGDPLIVLHKGPPACDSRRPDQLEARIEILDAPARARPGELIEARVALTNLGNTLWIALPRDPRTLPEDHRYRLKDRRLRRLRPLDYGSAFLDKKLSRHPVEDVRGVGLYRRFVERNCLEGMVTLGAHLWCVEPRALIDRDYARGFLPHDLPPGATAELSIALRAPVEAGKYNVEIDPVVEYVTWFADRGSATAGFDLTV